MRSRPADSHIPATDAMVTYFKVLLSSFSLQSHRHACLQGHSSLHCQLLIQVLLAWQVYSDNVFLESWFRMLKKCWRKLMLRCIQRGIAEDCCFFSSWATTNCFTNGGLRVYSDRISKCYFFASCGTTDCFSNGGLRCIQRGLLDAASLLHELVRFHLLPTFKHWRVCNLTTYQCHLGNI